MTAPMVFYHSENNRLELDTSISINHLTQRFSDLRFISIFVQVFEHAALIGLVPRSI